MDMNAMQRLLDLEEKLRGHPHLATSKSLVDMALVDMDAGHKDELAKLMADRKAKQEAEAKAQAEAEAKAKFDAEAKAKREAEEAAKAAPAPMFAKRDIVGGLPGPAERA